MFSILLMILISKEIMLGNLLNTAIINQIRMLVIKKLACLSITDLMDFMMMILENNYDLYDESMEKRLTHVNTLTRHDDISKATSNESTQITSRRKIFCRQIKMIDATNITKRTIERYPE